MRDDLHHSLPLGSPWRSVVKIACTPAQSSRLADAMTRAVWSSVAEWWESSWGREFRNLLSAQQQDMFSQEHLESALRHLEATAPDHFARRACEVTHAVLLSAEPNTNVARQVINAVLEVGLEDGIEAAVARIAYERPGHHAIELRRKLYSEIHNCNLSDRPAPRKRASRKTLEEGLSISLEARF